MALTGAGGENTAVHRKTGSVVVHRDRDGPRGGPLPRRPQTRAPRIFWPGHRRAEPFVARMRAIEL